MSQHSWDGPTLSRRRVLGTFGAGAAGLLLGTGCGRAATSSTGAQLSIGFIYSPPPKGTFNFLGGISSQVNLSYAGDLFLMPGGLYLHGKRSWIHLLASEKSGFSADGSSYDYVVRDGLTWSDGKPITATDVFHTWLLRWGLAHSVFANIDTFEQVDKRTVRFHIANPGPATEYYLLRERIVPTSLYGTFATRVAPLLKAGKANTDKDVATVISQVESFKPKTVPASGPYAIDFDSVSNASMVLKKNPKGYRSEKVAFDSVKVFNGEVPVLTPQVLSGDLDYTSVGFPDATLQQFRSQGIRVLKAPALYGTALFFNIGKFPEFRDKRVRQAFAFVIDRKQNAQVVGAGAKQVELLTGIPDVEVPTWLSPDVRAKLERYDHSLEKAASLLRDAGWHKTASGWVKPDGKPAQYDLLYTQDYPKYVSSAENLTDQFKAFGITTTRLAESSTQAPLDVQNAKFDLALGGWGASGTPPFPFADFASDFISNNAIGLPEGQKGIGFDPKQKTDVLGQVDLQAMVAKAGKAVDDKALKADVTPLCQAFNELLPIIPIYENIGANPVNTKKVGGFPSDSDPIYQNSPYSVDNFVVPLLYQGTIHPVAS